MESGNKPTSNIKAKKSGRKNEKKKKMEVQDNDVTSTNTTEVNQNLNEREETSSGSSTDSEDLVNAINYNTITSLAALKDIIQGDNNDTPETDSFFQHYFMNHCNNLSSRNANTNSPFPFAERRRLSQCREEDEDDEKKDHASPPGVMSPNDNSKESSQSNLNDISNEKTANVVNDEPRNLINKEKSDEKKSPIDGRDTSKRMVMGARHKFVVTTTEPPQSHIERALRSQVHNAHTVHFGTKGAEEQRPSVRSIFAGQNLHRDKNYFDSSLIEIRSTVDGIPTSSEDIWVKRTEEKKVTPIKPEIFKNKEESKKQEDPKTFASAQPQEPSRVRSGTWGSQTPVRVEKEAVKKTSIRKEKDFRRNSDDRRHKREQRLDAAITRSSQSVGERKRRGSADDGQAHPMYQQTIHGTSGVSRRPALFDMFKSKPKGDSKKQPSIMQQVKAAVQSMTKSGSSGKETSKSDLSNEAGTPDSTGPTPIAPAKVKDGSAHPHPGSDTRYYHTVTASASRRPSAMGKVMDIFRGRASVPSPSVPVDNTGKRRAVSK